MATTKKQLVPFAVTGTGTGVEQHVAVAGDAVGDFDPSVLAAGAEGNANFDAVRVTATIETDADEAQFERLRSETERRCPVTQLFVRSGLEFTATWTRAPLAA